MYTLIPEKNCKHVRYEYRLRFTTLILLFFSLASWIGVGSLFPSYIISVTEEGAAVRQANEIKASPLSKSATAINEQANSINTLVESVLKTQDTFFFSTIIEDLAKKKVSGVSITGFELTHRRDAASSTGAVGVIHGKALTRDALSAFENSLNTDTTIERVKFPLSSLTQSKDILFTLTIKSI